MVGLADRVQRSQLWVAEAALVILMLVTVLDVFMRYLFNRPIRASLETVEVMLLVFVFNGMAAAFFGRRHIVIDLLDGVFGARITGMLIRIADVLSVLCLGLLGEYVARLFQSSQRRPQFLVGYDSLEDQGHQEPVHQR